MHIDFGCFFVALWVGHGVYFVPLPPSLYMPFTSEKVKFCLHLPSDGSECSVVRGVYVCLLPHVSPFLDRDGDIVRSYSGL